MPNNVNMFSLHLHFFFNMNLVQTAEFYHILLFINAEYFLVFDITRFHSNKCPKMTTKRLRNKKLGVIRVIRAFFGKT